MPNRFQAIAVALLFTGLVTSITLHSVQSHDQPSASTEVRISARQLDDGRTEFALQQRDGDGWGERQLAQQRFLPAVVGHDRWLNSSPYTVSVALPEQEGSEGDQVLRPDLSPDMEQSNLWVALRNEDRDFLTVTIQTFADLDAYIVDLVVAAGGRGFNFCNPAPIFSGIPSSLGCEVAEVAHETVDNVAAAFGGTLRFDCIRHNLSTEERSLWACVPRE